MDSLKNKVIYRDSKLIIAVEKTTLVEKPQSTRMISVELISCHVILG